MTQFGRILKPESRRTSDIALRELDNGKHTFRIMEGGDILNQVMWPTEVLNDDDIMVQTWRSVKLAKKQTDTIMDKLGALERAARQRLVDKKPGIFGGGLGNIVLERSESRLYKVFYRGTDAQAYENPTLPIVLECGSVVAARKLAQLNSERSRVTQRDANSGDEVLIPCFRYGPTYLYDVIISKTPRSGQYSIEYDVTVGRNDWYEKCTVSRWPNGAPPPGFDFVAEGVFTKEEYENVMQTTIDLESSVTADDEQTIMTMLEDFPINLKARTKNKMPLFPSELADELRAMYIDAGFALTQDSSAGTTVALPGAPATDANPAAQTQATAPQSATQESAPPQAAQAAPTGNGAVAEVTEDVKSVVFHEIQAVIDAEGLDYMVAVHKIAKQYKVDEPGVPDGILIAKIVEAKKNGNDTPAAPKAPEAPENPPYSVDDDLPF